MPSKNVEEIIENGEKTAVQVATDYIKSLIVEKKIKKGDKIPTEMELSKKLNMGRGSIREAIKLLEAFRVLEIRRGDGTYVSEMKGPATLDSLYFKIILADIPTEELAEYRVQIENAIVQLVIKNATQDDILQLRASYNQFAEYVYDNEVKEPEVLSEMDLEFHHLLGKAAKNSLLEDIYLFSLDIFSPLMLKNYRGGKIYQDTEATLNNHKEILLAIENRDYYAAIYAIIKSVNLWKKWVVKTEDLNWN